MSIESTLSVLFSMTPTRHEPVFVNRYDSGICNGLEPVNDLKSRFSDTAASYGVLETASVGQTLAHSENGSVQSVLKTDAICVLQNVLHFA